MKTLKLIWNTYEIRRDIVKLWFIFSYQENWYIWNCNTITEKLENKIKELWLEYEELEYIEINEQYIVNQKNLRAEKKAEKYSRYSISTEKKAEQTKLSKQEENFLSLAEPVKIWHHSEKRHRKLIEKSWNTMWKRVALFEKAETYQDKAEYWKNKKFITTKEKEEKKQYMKEITEKALSMWKEDHKIGEEYIGWHTNNPLIIAKINKTTITTETWSKWDIKYSKDFDSYLQKAKNIM